MSVGVKSPDIELVAIADLRKEAVIKAAEDYNVKKAYTDADELLADDQVQGVVLAMPTAPRTELALKAFAKGKHVLTEKPVAMNAQEVEKMIAAKGDLVAACCSSRNRFQPSAEVITKFIAEGNLGDLRVLHCRVF
jgi:predicted dehydrogenase